MNLKRIGCEAAEWIHLAQVRDHSLALVNAVMNHRVPYKASNVLTA
jgi:hypothetical protein